MARKRQALALVVLSLILNALAITRYIPEGQETLFGLQPSSTDTSLASSYTGSAAYDPRTLSPPLPPTDPPVNTQFSIQLTSGDIPDLSIRHHGAFLGFSIEFSVSNHIRECSLVLYATRTRLISNKRQWAGTGAASLLVIDSIRSLILLFLSSTLSVPFLNLLANLQQRSGRITVRVGGNSQETAIMVASLAGGSTLQKDKNGLYNPVRR